ncbi:reverse transcriptase domain-containing protein [Tanacetum coccineum]
MVKNKGLVAEAYEWDEKDVSSDDNEMVEVKVLMALADDKNVAVDKESARNSEWVKISMRKVHALLEIEDNDERKTFDDYLCIDLDYVEEQRNNLLLKHKDLVQELNTCKEKLTVGHDVAYAMTWTDLKKKMTNKYCPRAEIKKLEAELWNLKVKGTDVIGYNQRFQELALLCVRMFPKESDKIERYVDGFPDMIHESVVASKPKTMQEAIEIATELMDKKIRTFAERQTENKRKKDDNHQQPQQQQNKRQNTGRAYTAGSGEKKTYEGSKPLCAKCNYHHDGPCAPKCHKCNRVGHLARDCRSTANTNTANNQRGTEAGQKPTCYEYGAQGHFKRDCTKLKKNNRGNQAGNGNAPAKVYAVGRVGTNPDSNVMTGTFCGISYIITRGRFLDRASF